MRQGLRQLCRHTRNSSWRHARTSGRCERIQKNSERLVEIYSIPQGYIGWAKIGKLNPAGFLSDGSLVSLEKDDADAPIIVVYEVVQR